MLFRWCFASQIVYSLIWDAYACIDSIHEPIFHAQFNRAKNLFEIRQLFDGINSSIHINDEKNIWKATHSRQCVNVRYAIRQKEREKEKKEKHRENPAN